MSILTIYLSIGIGHWITDTTYEAGRGIYYDWFTTITRILFCIPFWPISLYTSYIDYNYDL